MAANLAVSVASPFMKYLISPIGRQCGYILFYRTYLKELEQGVGKLKLELREVQRECVAAERNARDIKETVTKWIEDVNGAVKEADTLLLGAANTLVIPPLDDGCRSWFRRCVCLDYHPPVTLISQQAEQIADTLPQDVDLRVRKRFFYLNPVVRYKKGRKAKKTMLVVQGLNEDKKTLGVISREEPIDPILSPKDYESLGSRSEIVENIFKALSDEKVSVIGVWGMGGVGKSTLMNEVMGLARKKNLFDDVAFAVVSQNPDVKKIQGELATWLRLNFKDDEHLRTRAARLDKRLKPTGKKKSTAEQLETTKHDGMIFQRKKSTAAPVVDHDEEQDHEKQDAVGLEENQDLWGFPFFQRKKKSDNKNTAAPVVDHDEEQDQVHVEPVVEGKPDMKQKQVLIILDDIWGRLDLEEIGIPLDAVKLLCTSRKQNVLSREMGCSENVFQLKVLKDDESWKLFESVIGEKVGPDSEFRSIGEQLVEKCSGLPLVLNAIATTLRNCSLLEWKDALVQFERSKDAYSNLEISYKHLESDELKSLFLVCALTNHVSISVRDLLYYCMGLGLLKGTNTVRSARHKLKALLHSLQDSSLLLKDDIQDLVHVHIHDIVREVAIRIASRDQDSLLITDEFELKDIQRKKLKNSKAISIPYVNFRRLPEGWECPELRMFLLYRRLDDPLIGISDSFFEGMKELSVLDFSGLCSDSLPSSIQFLLNLNTLCLDYCSIEDLTGIGKLKQLQILTFIGSEIARLPKEIGELSELKVLNLEDSKLKIIEPQVLEKLTSLEELSLKGSTFTGWEGEGEMQPSNAKVSELNNLSNLSIVNIHIHNPSTIPKHLEFGNLGEYIIQIGDVWDWTGDYKESRMLKIQLELCRSSFLHEKWVQDLLKRTQNLHLEGTKGWQRSIHELCLDGFPELKHLRLQNNSLVQCVARSTSKWLPCTAFTVLESLFLEKLTGLETISRGLIATNSFSKLKVIKVIDCGKLKSLFSYSMLKCLSQLEKIEVRDCEAMQVIVTVDSAITNTDQVVKLEALHRIELHNLPNLMRFFSSHKLVDVDQTEIKPSCSSEIVQEDLCVPTNTMFPNDDQLVSFPLLKSLILTSLPKLKYIWQKNSSVEVAKLENLQVSSCDDLLIVIPSSLVKEVKILETLIVRDCGSVQEVFETGDDDVVLNHTSDDVEILSRLNNLELSNLPLLRHIWGNNHHQTEKVSVFQNLNSLTVVSCSSLKNLLPGTLLKSLNQLTKLRIKKCKVMEAFVPSVNDNIEFQSLVDVWLEDLPNMVTFVWTKGCESINFPSMKELYVKECPKMASFSLKEDESAPTDQLCFFDDKVLLPVLARLDFISMKSIQKIWHEKNLEQSFCPLEILLVWDCQALVDAIPSINLRVQFDNLKEITIRECISFEGPVFKFAVEDTTGKEYYSLPQLEKLRLFNLPKLKHVVQPDSHVVVGFPSLAEISVVNAKRVIDVFPIATVTTLSKLEDLKVWSCRSMTHIFGKDEEAAEEEEEDEMLDSILFPCLRSINVQDLDSLISVFSGISCMLGFPSLEALQIGWCSKLKTFVQSDDTSDQTLEGKEGVHYYLFDDKVQLPNLKKVELWDLSTLQTVWKTNLPCLSICDRIWQITEITIKACENLEEFIFESDNGEKETKTTDGPAVFHSLANVMLGNLPNMVAFIRARRDQSIIFPSLKELKVRCCQKMRAFYLPNTEESGGGGGESSLPLCFFDHKVLLPKLLLLDFISVGSMEKIWHEDFSQIEKLHIKDCQNLVNVFPSINVSGTQRLPFQNLKEIIIRECNKLEGSLFEFARVGEEKGNGLSLPELEKLWLFDLPKLEHVIHPSSDVLVQFQGLVEISVADCECIVDLLPIATSATISKLEKVNILRCNSMRHVFGIVGAEEKDEMLDSISFPCLRSIQVRKLNSLICFFLGNARQFYFPSLEDLEFSLCLILKTFIHKHANEGIHYFFDEKVQLPNLKKMKLFELGSLVAIWKTQLPCLNSSHGVGKIREITIQNCKKVEEIICESDDSDGEFKTMEEPAVFSLVDVRLVNLPKVVAFVKGRRGRSINFPFLKELYVKTCPKTRAFYLPSTEENGDESLPLCFFDLKVIFPKVVQLDLVSVGSIEKIWREEIAEEFFFQLEKLIVRDCQNLVNVFPPSKYVSGTQSRLRFQNLKEIIVSECNSLQGSLFEFVCEGEEKGKGLISLPQLEKLWLFNLPKLEHVIHPTSDVLFEFPSLVDISVEDCQCIIDLLPRATAATLPKLEEVQILRCSSMRYVFGDKKEAEEEDEMLDLISFPCLRTIQVQDMNSLICFFSGTDCQLDFPHFEDLEISRCPVLKTFVQRQKNENVHYLFDEKVEFPMLQKMELFQLSSLQTIWKNDELLPSSDSCTRLKSLTVWDCKDLQHIFSGNLARHEELFAFGGGRKEKPLARLTAEGSELVICFRELEHLRLQRLPSLTSFSSANCKFKLPSLEEVIVIECPNLKVFSSNSVVAPKLSKVLLTVKEQKGKVRWDGDLNTTLRNLPK